MEVSPISRASASSRSPMRIRARRVPPHPAFAPRSAADEPLRAPRALPGQHHRNRRPELPAAPPAGPETRYRNRAHHPPRWRTCGTGRLARRRGLPSPRANISSATTAAGVPMRPATCSLATSARRQRPKPGHRRLPAAPDMRQPAGHLGTYPHLIAPSRCSPRPGPRQPAPPRVRNVSEDKTSRCQPNAHPQPPARGRPPRQLPLAGQPARKTADRAPTRPSGLRWPHWTATAAGPSRPGLQPDVLRRPSQRPTSGTSFRLLSASSSRRSEHGSLSATAGTRPRPSAPFGAAPAPPPRPGSCRFLRCRRPAGVGHPPVQRCPQTGQLKPHGRRKHTTRSRCLPRMRQTRTSAGGTQPPAKPAEHSQRLEPELTPRPRRQTPGAEPPRSEVGEGTEPLTGCQGQGIGPSLLPARPGRSISQSSNGGFTL